MVCWSEPRRCASRVTTPCSHPRSRPNAGIWLGLRNRSSASSAPALRSKRSLPVFRARNLDVIVLTKAGAPTENLPRGVRVIHDHSEASGAGEASGALDLSSLLVQLRARYGIDRLLCEGGPTLVGSLLRSGTIDEFIMVISPRISGGDDPRVVLGEDLRPLSLSLVAQTVVDGFVFLRYRLSHEATT